MIWRACSFLAGLPLGALAGWVACGLVGASPRPALLVLGAGLGAGALVLVASLVARARDDDPARGIHLARAASSGWIAAPALAAAAWRLAPHPAWLLAGVVAALSCALWRGARARGPAGGPPALVGAAALSLLGGSLAVAVLAIVLATARGRPPSIAQEIADAVYDVDAGVVTQPLPHCRAEPAAVELLLDRGARPRASRDGARVWFDASVDGARQIHLLDVATGAVTCWTCGEPGDNLRAAPADNDSAIVFETTRHAHALDPTNSEIMLASVRGSGGPRHPSRRLTFDPGPDDHALFAPGSNRVVWSKLIGGHYAVVSSSLRGGHGALDLGPPVELAAGGAAWVAPVAWAPTARSLVVVRGNPYRPREAKALDLATGAEAPLAADLGIGTSASFSADGGLTLLAAAPHRARVAGLLPGSLGLLLAPAARRLERDDALLRGTEIRIKVSEHEAVSLRLGERADWGEPTGVALIGGPQPETLRFVLAQRRAAADSVEERLLLVTLACPAPSEGARSGSLPSPRAHPRRDP